MVHTTESPWSATSSDIRQTMRRLLTKDTDAVIATVVDVDGSGYRRPGAKMIIGEDGESIGAVTAGCLEGPIVDVAQQTFTDGVPRLETYDLTNTEDNEWGLGLGCNGVIDIFLEPLDISFEPVVGEFAAKRSATVLTVIESGIPDITIGDRTVVAENGQASRSRDKIPTAVVNRALDSTNDSGPSTAVTVSTEDGDIRVFVDQLEPTPDLLLFGSQEDINPVASLAAQAGFRVQVATSRGARVDDDRFPAAEKVVATHPTDLNNLVTAPEHTYAVLMSHNFLDDQLALDALLDTQISYIGLMGPRKRFQKLRETLDRELDASDCEQIATPVGLDLGSGDPTAIGFSIVAELIAVHNDRDGGRLKKKEGPIHNRANSG
ncbi:cytochrome oxidase I [halophilic archaeon]|nr:cytochrome oxidase I [halophilic archaeon]